jgi:hypothetical protein
MDSLSGGHEKKSVTVRHNWASFMAIPFRVLRPRGFFRHKSPLTVWGEGDYFRLPRPDRAGYHSTAQKVALP